MKQIIPIWKRYETDNTDMEKEKEDYWIRFNWKERMKRLQV